MGHTLYINLLEKFRNLQIINLNKIHQVWYHSMQQKMLNRTPTSTPTI